MPVLRKPKHELVAQAFYPDASSFAARAAWVPSARVLEELDRRGLMRIEDFFERNPAGIVTVRNLETVPVEVAIAFLRVVGELERKAAH
ncbi:MAG: hypothetical protein QOD56_3158 [Gammaproteobacteria bacterium]|jgi:hypothetical protein|nr:hypothetical protein [Gammaproteobacteria bacterium]